MEKRSDVVDLAKLQKQCDTQFSGTDYYSMMAQESSVNLGPSFQAIKQFLLGDGMSLSQIELPESLVSQANDYQLHPVLIDATFQAAIASSTLGKGTYLPISVGKLHRYHHSGGNRFWGGTQTINSGEQTVTTNILLLDESGIPVAEIEGFTMGRVSPATIQHHFQKKPDDLYEVSWRAHQLGIEKTVTDASPGTWLIFADRSGAGEELAEHLKESGNTCVMVYPEQTLPRRELIGSRTRDGENIWHVDPTEPGDFERLFMDTLREETLSLRGIVHLWSLDIPDASQLTTETLVEARILGCGSVLHLLQAEIKQNQSARLWLITRNAVNPEQMPSTLAVAQAPLWGMGKVIAREHPELWGGIIDNPKAADLLAEITSESNEGQVAYRNNQRYVARLVKSNMPASDSSAPLQLSLQPDNSYLITGGLGALGLEVARWMVDEGVRHLVLTGRHGPSDEAQEILTQLEKTGARILVAGADVSNRAQVVRLLEEIDANMPPIRGIIHAAGILDDGVLLQQNLERFDKVMAPKVSGTWHLHTLTQNQPLDFFVCFSSMASLLGSPGQSNYAAANAFMDALAHHRRAMDLPGLSVNWGTWAKVGMTVDLDTRQKDRLVAMGIATLDPERGISLLGELMRQTESIQVGVSPVNWSKFLKQFPVVPAFLSELHRALPDKPSRPADFVERLKKIPPEKQRDYLSAHIQSELNRVLGFDPSQPMDPQKGFSDLGMDSLMVMESRNRLQASFGHPLSSTLLFNYSTLDTLVDYIANEILASEALISTESSAKRDKTTKASKDVLSEVKQLSEKDLEDLIDNELESLG